MDKPDTGIVLYSLALEGFAMSAPQADLLFGSGISSQGMGIGEQLLALDLLAAWKRARTFVQKKEYWTPFRIKELGEVALRGTSAARASGYNTLFAEFGFAGVGAEIPLAKVCALANSVRLHARTMSEAEIYTESFRLHYRVSNARIWGGASNLMGRLLMNYLQLECGVEPTIVQAAHREEYNRLLAAALREDIEEIFVSYMTDRREDAPESEDAPEPAPKPSPEDVHRAGSREQILRLLSAHPRMTTAELAESIGISSKGVEKQVRILKASGLLVRIGPDKGGRWKVVEA